MDIAGLESAKANLSQSVPKLSPHAARKVEEAAQDFEAMFISQMLEVVWSTVPTDGPMSGGKGEEIFRSLMLQDVGKQMSKSGGIGMKSQIMAELIRMQEGAK